MKKAFSFITAIFCCISLIACSTGTSDNTINKSVERTEQVNVENALVVYFSMPETSEPDNMTMEEENSTVVIDGAVLGNTQYAAMVIQENTGADIFRIEPQEPYTTNHEELVDIASKEQEETVRPAIKGKIINFEQYDTVFVGYPIWWSDMPMIMYSFFDEYDFSGKTIVPFSTHGGSGFADTIAAITKLEPDAVVQKDGFTVTRNDIENAKDDIISWLNELENDK